MAQDASPAAAQLYREVLLDPKLQDLREQYCRVTAVSLTSVASWIGFDSFLGGGDMSDAVRRPAEPDVDRHLAFRATASVIEMASELAAESVGALEHGHRFAASALIRQLIETEYLLTCFGLDFSTATRWASSTPEEIRRSFSPSSMRAVGGFSNHEYWQHCAMGGHPSPSGRSLLQFNLAVAPSDDAFFTASVWGDLAQHLRRLWARVDSILREQHARYSHVRASEAESVRVAETSWVEVDPLAGPVDFELLNALVADVGDRG